MTQTTTTQLVGHVINSQYRLLEYLGGSEHSAVFLTEHGDSGQKAAIKLVVAHPEIAEIQLLRWEHASQFPHPHLIQLLDAGHCEIDGAAMLYVVMEYAGENLSQVLGERALTAEETGDVLEPVLEVLSFLHSNGFVHAHLKPSNILAIDDNLKLSSDSICRFGEPRDSGRQEDAYDAPEISNGKFASAVDFWSLGMTLVEGLTQRLPFFDSQQPPAAMVPDTLPAVFRDIAENCLIRDPQRRWTEAEVSGRVRGISPVVVPQPAANPEPEIRAAAKPEARPEARPEVKRQPEPEVRFEPQPEARRDPVRETSREDYPEEPKIWRYVAAVVVVLVVIFAAVKLFHRSAPSASAQQASIESPQENAQSAPAPVSSPAPSHPTRNAPEKKAGAPSVAPSQPVTSGSSNAEKTSNVVAAKAAPGGAAPAEVLHKVLPTVSDRARATIQGTVHVAVKVDVDAGGNVTNATLDPASTSSKYFTDLGLQAARDWKFKPAQPEAQAAASQWVLHFMFTQADTTAFSAAP
jgi:eukaryotic-like serine/threonine-protein kinase